MRGSTLSRRTLFGAGLASAVVGCAAPGSTGPRGAIAFPGARWLDEGLFRAKTAFSVEGRLTFVKPERIDAVVDLSGAFVVPPFADAHNHGIGTGVEARDRAMIDAYLRAGVFYMQSQGNLPLTREDKQRLGLNTTSGLDARFAQGSLTGVGGHPMGLIRDVLLPRGAYPGRTLEDLNDVRFFQIDTAETLQAKWSAIRALEPDFIKVFLIESEDYASRRDDPAYFGKRGIDPQLVRPIVDLAHGVGLRVAAHVASVTDFRVAVDAGVDTIAHVPTTGVVTPEDARMAAERGMVVVTTCAFLSRVLRIEPATLRETQRRNLGVLRSQGVRIAIGSDDPADPTPGELQYLRGIGVFSDAELLRMWTEVTPQAIFPERRIGRLEEGFEASFLALAGNPLDDWSNTASIRLAFKQGQILSRA